MGFQSNQYLSPVIVIPSALEISSISQSQNMIVTTTANSDQVNTYIQGQLVRLTIPYSFGMYQANRLTGKVIDNDGVNITLDIDSSGFDPFMLVSGQIASIAPAGSQNLTLDNFTKLVPFQNLNNIGN